MAKGSLLFGAGPTTAAEAAAKPAIVKEAFSMCGTCVHGVMNPQAMDLLDCHGVPPTPVVMGMAHGPQGAGVNVQLLRPQVMKTTRACSLHKTRLAGLM